MADARFIPDRVMTDRAAIAVSAHKVLRNTYMLLSMTLLFSAAMAALSMSMNMQYMGWMPLIVAFGLIFAISKMRNSVWGIVLVFAFTGILGFSLGPMLNLYMSTAGGTQTVVTAIGLTGLIFLSLSGYTLISQKDFSYLSGFLMTCLIVVIGCMLLLFFGSFFGIYVSGAHLAISAVVVILMAGLILYDTSRILHGGETNYIMATVALYLDIYNMFVHLLMLLGIFGGDD